MKYAIIGGTGVYGLGIKGVEKTINTSYGPISFDILNIGGEEIAFLPRHGKIHGEPPHKINYRGNIQALKEWGAEFILSTVAVGSARADIKPGDLVLLDDFLDFTKGRPSTFFNGKEGVFHVSMKEPYCRMLKAKVLEEAKRTGLMIHPDVIYVCTEGPRFETAAEIRFYSQIGGDVVGMTNVPEVVLAKEMGMCYGAVGIVTNWCTGLGTDEAPASEIIGFVDQKKELLAKMFLEIFSKGDLDRSSCGCRSALIKL